MTDGRLELARLLRLFLDGSIGAAYRGLWSRGLTAHWTGGKGELVVPVGSSWLRNLGVKGKPVGLCSFPGNVPAQAFGLPMEKVLHRLSRGHRASDHLAARPAPTAIAGRLTTWQRLQVKREVIAGRPKPTHCEICLRRAAVEWEHSHETGRFRGWACRQCNMALGFVQDDVRRLLKLAHYLRCHSPNPLDVNLAAAEALLMTALPIDYRCRPWRHKYIEEERLFARWFIFGESEDGSVDICAPGGDVFSHVPRDVAARIQAARDAFCDAILAEIG